MKILITGGNGNIAKIIKNNLGLKYNIVNLSKSQLNILNEYEVNTYLSLNNFDILIHTAIAGGRRTKEETSDIVYYNLLMFENLAKHANKFKMIINFDSAAIYDRKTNIYNRKEEDIFSIPTDYYGFSKYLIYNRSLYYNNIYNFRIFNIFHTNEEPDRFIKKCIDCNKKGDEIIIFEDKYFDFVYEDDFIKIIEYYINNIENQSILDKTINICYDTKYKLSEIAKLIIQDHSKIKILNDSSNNYCGNNTKLSLLNIKLNGLERSIKLYLEKNKLVNN